MLKKKTLTQVFSREFSEISYCGDCFSEVMQESAIIVRENFISAQGQFCEDLMKTILYVANR